MNATNGHTFSPQGSSALTAQDLEDYNRGRPGAAARFHQASEAVFLPSSSSAHMFPSSASASAGVNIASNHATTASAFSSGSPFGAHSRDNSVNSNGLFSSSGAGASPLRDSFTSPRPPSVHAPAAQRAIGFEVGRGTNGNGQFSTGSTSRTSSLGPVARPPATGGNLSRTASDMDAPLDGGYGSSHGGYGVALPGSGTAATLGSLAISDEDLLGDLSSLNLGGGPQGPTSAVLARVQHDNAHIQHHPSVRVPSNYAAQSGVHAASVPSGFGLGQLWGNNGVTSSTSGSGLGNNGSMYGSSPASNASSSYSNRPLPAGMSASTSSHLFNRPSHQISPHVPHAHAIAGLAGPSSSAAAEYLHGSSSFYGAGGGSQPHHHLQQHHQHHHSQGQHPLLASHHASHAHAHPLSASWNESGVVTPGTSAPPASGARMQELAERLHRHHQQVFQQQQQQQQQYQQKQQHHQHQLSPSQLGKHGVSLSRDLGGASWGTSGSPTASGMGGVGGGSGINAAAAALGRSPASTSGLARRLVTRTGSPASISRYSLGGGGGGTGSSASASDFDAQSSHSESDWVDDEGPEEELHQHQHQGNGSYHHHNNGRAYGHEYGSGVVGDGSRARGASGAGDEYEEGEEGAGGAGSRTPTARTSRHRFGGMTSLSGITAAATAAQQQQQQQLARGRAAQAEGHGHDSRSSNVHVPAPHGLSELAIASLAALGGGAGGGGGFDVFMSGGGGGSSSFGSGGGQASAGLGSAGLSSSSSFGMLSSFGGFTQQQQMLLQQSGLAGPGGGFAAFGGAPGVAELGKGVPLQTLAKDTPLYIVEFKQGRKELYFAPDTTVHGTPRERERIVNGDLVIVEADRGKDLGTVVYDALNVEQVQAFLVHQSDLLQAQMGAAQGLSGDAAGGVGGASAADVALYARLTRSIHPKRLYGKASANDTSLLLTKAQDEDRALQLCRTKVSQRGLPMVVVAAEMQWDRRKLTFYYTASARVDFRDLVKELFRLYKTRIWMCHLAR
ncbi:hypothetical protein V8E36_001840 [Tilletia maclaganii]